MADSSTTHYELIKQDLNEAPDQAKENTNLDILDSALYAVEQNATQVSSVAVRIVEQTLTAEQQEQARENIGVYGKDDTQKRIVMVSAAKTLTSGAFSIDYPTGTSMNTHYFIVQPIYSSGGYVGWMPIVQAQAANINIYVRVGGSATTPPVYPPNGTSVSFVMIAIPR